MNFNGATAAPLPIDGKANPAAAPAVNERRRIICISSRPAHFARIPPYPTEIPFPEQALFCRRITNVIAGAAKQSRRSQTKEIASPRSRRWRSDLIHRRDAQPKLPTLSGDVFLLEPLLALHFIKPGRRAFRS